MKFKSIAKQKQKQYKNLPESRQQKNLLKKKSKMLPNKREIQAPSKRKIKPKK
jgi:hypothetical protein